MKGMALAVAVFFLALSAGEVYAQGKGGGRGRGKAPKGPHERGGLPGRGGGGPDSIRWVASMAQAMSPRGERETKPECILIYVHAPGEAREDATAFNGSLEVARLSRSSAVFHRVAYDPENEWIRRWGVSRSPAFVGADLYGNAFQVIYRISPSQICSPKHRGVITPILLCALLCITAEV